MFGSELALEFYHDDIASKVKEFFQHDTAQSLAKHIKNSEEFEIQDSLIIPMREYSSILAEYDTENLAKIMYKLLDEVRPDLAKTMDILGEEAAIWFYKCVDAIRDRVVNPARYEEETDKALTIKVTCSCGKSWRIFKENIQDIKACPFCGASSENETDTSSETISEEEK